MIEKVSILVVPFHLLYEQDNTKILLTIKKKCSSGGSATHSTT